MMWEKILFKWCNCLELSRNIEKIDDLRDGVFFSNILCLIEKSEELKEGEDSFKTLTSLLNSNYINCQINYDFTSMTDSCLRDISEDELIVLTSLLMHYTCLVDQKDALTSPLCNKLSKKTQLCIRNFLQLVKPEITRLSLDKIIHQLSSSNDHLKINDATSSSSPLIGIFSTPPVKTGKFLEKDREISKLKTALAFERDEKADLQEELKVQIKKNENLLNKKDDQIAQLKKKIIEIECKTPPSFQCNNSVDTEKRLRREIQSLEHYIEKTDKEHEQLQEEAFRNRKKLAEWELEYADLQAKYLESENQLNHISTVNKEQSAKISCLESHCDELKNILEEYRSNPVNESSTFSNYSCSFAVVEENLASSVVEIQLEEANRKNEELRLEMNTMKERLDKGIEELNLKLNNTAEEKEKLAEEMKSLKNLLESKSLKIDEITTKYEQLEFDYKQSEVQNKNLEGELKKLKKDKEQLCDEIKSLKDLVCHKNTTILEKDNLIEKLKEEYIKLEDDLVMFDSKLNESEEKRSILNVNIKEKNTEIKLLKDALEGKIVEMKSLENLIEERKTIISEKDDFIRNLEGECVQFRDDLKRLKSELDESEQRQTLQEKTIEENDTEIKSLRNSLESKIEEINEIATKNERLEYDFKRSEVQNKNLEADLWKLEEEKKKLCDEMESLENLTKHRNTIVSEKDNFIKNLQEECVQLKDHLKRHKSELEDSEQRRKLLEETIRENNAECEKISLENGEYVSELKRLENNIETLEHKVEDIQYQLEKSENAKEILERTIQEKDVALQRILFENEELSNEYLKSTEINQCLKKTIEEKNLEYQKISLDNKGNLLKLQSLEELEKKHLDRIQILEVTIREKNEEHEKLVSENNSNIKTLGELKSKNDQLEMSINNITLEKDASNQMFSNKKQRLESIIEEKANEIRQLKILKTQVDSLHIKFKEKNKEIYENQAIDEVTTKNLANNEKDEKLKKSALQVEETDEEYLKKIQEMEESFREITTNFDNLKSDFNHLSQLYRESIDYDKEYQAKIQSLEDLLEVKNNELDQVVYSTKKYIEKIQSLEDGEVKNEMKINQLTFEIGKLEEHNVELSNDLQTNRIENEKLESSMKEVSTSLQNSRAQIDELKLQYISAEEKIAELEREKQKLLMQIEEILCEQEEKALKCEKLEEVIKKHLIQVESLKVSRNELKTYFNEKRFEFVSEITNLENFVHKMIIERDEISLELEKVRGDKDEYFSKISLLENNMKEERVDFLKTEKDLKNKIKRNDEIVEHLEMENDKLTNECNKSQNKIQLLETEVEELNSLLKKSDENSTEFSTKLQLSESKKLEYENENEKLIEKLKCLELETEQLGTKNKEFIETLKKLNEKCESYIQQLKEASEQITLERNENQEKINKLDGEIRYMTDKIEELQNNIDFKDEKILSLKKLSEENTKIIDDLEARVLMLKDLLSQYKRKFGKTEQEYEATLANLQVQIVSSKLEVAELNKKHEECSRENQRVLCQLKEFEKENQKLKNIELELENENDSLKKKIEENENNLKDAIMLKENFEKNRVEMINQRFLEEKQMELQQKVQTLIEGNELQKTTYDEFKGKYKTHKNELNKLLSQKNILDTLTNNLRLSMLNVFRSVPAVNYNMRKLLDKREDLEIITEDIIKQNNKYSKQINNIVFEIVNYYEKNCDSILTSSDLKTEIFLEKHDLEEFHQQISDLTDRTQDAFDQVKTLQKDLDALNKVKEELEKTKENVLVETGKINVVKMKEDELKKKNSSMRQKITLLENSKSNLEKTVKKLREENKKLKGDNNIIDTDVHYKMILQEYIEYKEKQEEIQNENRAELENLRKELENIRRTSTPIEQHFSSTENEARLLSDLSHLRDAYSSIRALNAKLETENIHSKKLIEEHKQELSKVNQIKEAYDKLLEENNKLMTDVDTIKYKRTRDRDEFLRLLKKERTENEAKNLKQIQNIKTEYDAKLERMKEKMLQSYKEEVSKEMHKLKEEQHENSSLLKIVEKLKGTLFESEQKIQCLEMERDFLKRAKDASNLCSSRESLSTYNAHEPDIKNSISQTSTSSSSNNRKLMEFKHPSKVNPSGLDTRRQYEERRSSTLPRTITEEITLSRKTSYGVPDAIGRNMQMEDEEEMFNNKYLTDLKQGNCNLPASSEDRGSRVSELAWRNSLVPPHLKSSYPAETQFCSPGRFKEDDLKAGSLAFDDSLCKLLPGDNKPRKKDIGTTSYKKPGPPTPSKNGGRLSLQGNEVHPTRDTGTEVKRSTPSRIRALFSGKSTTKSNAEVSPARRRLNIFRR